LIAHAKNIVDRNGDGNISAMGAAVRNIRGEIFGGINLYHFTGGPCAEIMAVEVAAANGAGALDTIVAVGDNGRGPVGPCGRCRQVLFDYHPTIRVLLPTKANRQEVKSVPINDLLPFVGRWDVELGTLPFNPDEV
jgi:cytidine deaminase